jgi:hypothetical protein
MAEGPNDDGAPGEISEECRAFRKDVNADLGDVLRAGCEPTLAQMSALMDNPLGNVAMWINQVDWIRLDNDQNSRSAEDQVNYMGIFQFPVGISEDWNTINRIVYSVPSSPINQGDADRLAGFSPSQPVPGGPTQPPDGGPGGLPIDLISGRTTGFGDLYYVGFLSPKKGIKHENGATSVWGIGLDAAFPTATDDLLGTGRYSMGPAALYAYLGKQWKLAALAQTYFDYAGDDDRDDVSLLLAPTSSPTSRRTVATPGRFPWAGASTGPSRSASFPCAWVSNISIAWSGRTAWAPTTTCASMSSLRSLRPCCPAGCGGGRHLLRRSGTAAARSPAPEWECLKQKNGHVSVSFR